MTCSAHQFDMQCSWRKAFWARFALLKRCHLYCTQFWKTSKEKFTLLVLSSVLFQSLGMTIYITKRLSVVVYSNHRWWEAAMKLIYRPVISIPSIGNCRKESVTNTRCHKRSPAHNSLSDICPFKWGQELHSEFRNIGTVAYFNGRLQRKSTSKVSLNTNIHMPQNETLLCNWLKILFVSSQKSLSSISANERKLSALCNFCIFTKPTSIFELSMVSKICFTGIETFAAKFVSTVDSMPERPRQSEFKWIFSTTKRH